MDLSDPSPLRLARFCRGKLTVDPDLSKHEPEEGRGNENQQ